MNLHLLRHATLDLTIGNKKLLVDPMLGAARTYEAIANTANQQRNPLVDLPIDDEALGELLAAVNGVLVTHLHNDHWDGRARELLAKTLPVLCQPEDKERIEESGFQAVQAVNEAVEWNGLQIVRTGGQHGRGKIGKLMAPVSGFVIKMAGEPVVYIAGDTIWCAEVEEAIDEHEPDVIVVNAGAAQFTSGGPITMDAEDVIKVANGRAEALVVAVHMEAINHCLMRRSELEAAVRKAGVGSRVYIPNDDEQIPFTI